MAKKRILIIDDEKDLNTLLKTRLESMGDFVVDTVASGKAGLEAAHKTKPDLILLDICMPGLDGYEVIKRLKKDDITAGIPVVMLSAIGDIEAIHKSAELDNEDYIVKPIDADKLREKLDKVFKRRG